MEIRGNKSDLIKKFSFGVNITSSKPSTLPILSNILLETKQNCLQIIATDMEVGVCTQTPVEVLKEGSITVPARKFYDIIRELPDSEVSISVSKNNSVNIKSGKAFFKVMGIDKEDYPKLPEFSLNDALEVDQSLLKECFSLTSFAISHDETRYVLNGVLLIVEGKSIKFVATDGRRLAYYEKELSEKAKKDFQIIVPSKAIQELIKLLDWEGKVKIEVSQNKAVFDIGETSLSTSLIEGKFPNYEQVIPKNKSTTVEVGRESLLQAVRRASLLTSTDSPALKLDFVKNKIIISSKAPNMGESKEEITAICSGKEVSVGFNPGYLMDVLKNLDVDNVTLDLTDPDKPGLVSGKEGYVYVIMPMQIH